MADKQPKAGKKLPDRASKSHPKHAKRMGHKARAQVRHNHNRIAQTQRELDNIVLREFGKATPWELACVKRAENRNN